MGEIGIAAKELFTLEEALVAQFPIPFPRDVYKFAISLIVLRSFCELLLASFLFYRAKLNCAERLYMLYSNKKKNANQVGV